MNKRSLTGSKGEDIAAAYFRKNNYRIIRKNYRWRRFEIDLIMIYKDTLVFAEVKTRSSDDFAYPEETVNEGQMNRIIEAAENFIYETDWRGPIRFDVLSVFLQGADIEIRHFEDAFY